MGANKFKKSPGGRLLAAALSLIVTLGCMWWLYDQEFRYPNTGAGRLDAVTDYIVSGPDSTMEHNVEEGTPMRVIAWAEERDHLFLFYGADNRDNVHGIVHLVRGINGKYRTVNASIDPFPYTAGVYAGGLWVKGEDWSPMVIAGDGCRDIAAAAVQYTWLEEDGRQWQYRELVYELTEPDFLWLLEWEDIQKELDLESETLGELHKHGVRLLDENGEDITDRYRDEAVSQSWGSSKSTAEQGMLYVFLAAIALAGGGVTCWILRKKE